MRPLSSRFFPSSLWVSKVSTRLAPQIRPPHMGPLSLLPLLQLQDGPIKRGSSGSGSSFSFSRVLLFFLFVLRDLMILDWDGCSLTFFFLIFHCEKFV